MDNVRQRRDAPLRIREALATSTGGHTVRELAALTRLHENAVRRTLAALVAQGEVRVERQRSGARGRPLLRYRLVGAADEPFKAVLPMLLELLDASGVSPEAGYAGGFAHGSAVSAPSGTREAIVSSLVNLGFAPVEQPAEGTGIVLDLMECPFRDAVTGSRNGRQICHLHHGLVASIAAATGGELAEFVINDPRVVPCRVRFRELASSGGAAT
jgi:predicted ArsR family transcriptional regulator